MFFLENTGEGEKFYRSENTDNIDVWCEHITRIFVGIDISTGFYVVEGNTLLHDELNAIRGLDEKDLPEYAVVAQYILALKAFNLLDKIGS